MDKISGDMYTGEDALKLIGVGSSSLKNKIKCKELEKWRVFVQSTSANRVLISNTGFLYEI